MKLETFFEKFDLFADAPDAVAKLRELVLELAVRGGLVPHRADESPIPYASADRDPINVPSVPENWRVVLLADAIKNRSGNSKLIKGKLHSEPATGLYQGFSASGADVWCDDFEHEGDAIIISAVGARCGKAFKASGKWCAIANTNITRLEPAFLDFEFAYLFLNNERFWVRGGSAQPFVKFPPSLDRYFALPPLPEQKRIVAKVDELMALCDRLEAQQQDRESRERDLARAALARFADAPTPANLDLLFHQSFTVPPSDLRKSILSLAVQGKLVPQDPNDEPAIANLDEIDSEKAALIDARKLRPNRVTEIPQTKALQFEAPDSWRWFRLGDVAFFQEGPGIRNWQFRPEGIKLLNVQNIVDGKLVLENTDRHISTGEFESTYRHFAVETGDILFASSGASWGKTTWFVDPGYTVMLNTSMVRLKFYSKRCADAFLLLFLRSEFFKTQMEIQLVGIQPNFGSTHLGRVYIPIPPLPEQKRIVAKVDELMALVDQLEAQQAAARTTAEKLLEAAVAELTVA